MEHVPSIIGWSLVALVLYIMWLHYQERQGNSNQRVAPRPSDLARLQILDQTRSAMARKQQIRAKMTR